MAGTAGKTTTTSMLTVAAQHCGVDPSFAIGGDLNESGSNAHHGSGDLFIAEADESDGSFLLLSPAAAVVTNVEVDHLDQHGTPEAYVRAFEEFLGRIDPAGFLVVCVDDPGGRRLAGMARTLGLAVRTYGEAEDADLRLVDVSVRPDATTYDAVLDGAAPVPVRIGVAGRHMALNSAAALLAGRQLGLPVDPLVAGLAAYTGVRRRFEFKGMADGVRVFDDYAHAPAKIAAQLRAARVVAGSGRLIVAFQPHLYSRTRAFGAELGAALGLADEVVVMAVYGAREDPIPGVTGASVAAAVSPAGRAGPLRALMVRGRAGPGGNGPAGRRDRHHGRRRRHDGRSGGARRAGRESDMRTLVDRRSREIGRPDTPRRRGPRRRSLIAGAVAVLLVAGCYVVFFTALFSVRSVTVTGLTRLTRAEVLAAAAVPAGVPMARFDPAPVRQRVAALPRVARVEVSRHWPSGLVIAIRERVGVAYVVEGGRQWLVDASGMRFAPVAHAIGLPRLATADAPRAARRAAVDVAAHLPAALRAITTSVSVTDSTHVTLNLTRGRTALWGDTGDGATKARALLALLKRQGTTYDVSTPPVVVVH